MKYVKYEDVNKIINGNYKAALSAFCSNKINKKDETTSYELLKLFNNQLIPLFVHMHR